MLTELAPGLLRLQLPLPFQLNHVHVHLLRHEGRWILIDAGLGTGESDALIEEALRAASIGWRDIREIVLTHVHPDHMGGTLALLERTGAQLSVHGADLAHLAEFVEGAGVPAWMNPLLRECGLGEEALVSIEEAFAAFRRRFQILHPDRILHDGGQIAGLDVLWTPGHAPGHVCLFHPRERWLIAGDHLLPDITPNIGWLPDLNPVADYHASLDRIAPLDIGRIFPSHGAEFTGHRAWIAATKAHHQARCGEILRAIDAGAGTAGELVRHLWPKPLNPFNHRFALLEVLSHLVWLESRGQARRTLRGGIARWERNFPPANA